MCILCLQKTNNKTAFFIFIFYNEWGGGGGQAGQRAKV